jgi:Asp/Glu/hydantoin racemase
VNTGNVNVIRLLNTSIGTGASMCDLFKAAFPETVVNNTVDDSIVREIIENSNLMTASVVKRVCAYVIAAEQAGDDLVVICCSTISGLSETAKKMVSIPVMGIDEPMAELAVSNAHRIMVLATIPTTLGPSLELLKRTAVRLGKSVELDSLLCKQARSHLDRGQADRHDAILKREIEKAFQRSDIVVLAQASMARVIDAVDLTMKDRVLTSPPIALQAIRERFF